MTIDADVERVIKQFRDANKPMGLVHIIIRTICIFVYIIGFVVFHQSYPQRLVSYIVNIFIILTTTI